jgi:hypothetical protein
MIGQNVKNGDKTTQKTHADPVLVGDKQELARGSRRPPHHKFCLCLFYFAPTIRNNNENFDML